MLTTDGLMYLAVEMRKILSCDQNIAEYDIWFNDNTGSLDKVDCKPYALAFASFEGKIVSMQNHDTWTFTVTYHHGRKPSLEIACDGIRTIKDKDELMNMIFRPQSKCTVDNAISGMTGTFTTRIELSWNLYDRTADYMHSHAKKCIELIMATGSKDEVTKMEYDSLD